MVKQIYKPKWRLTAREWRFGMVWGFSGGSTFNFTSFTKLMFTVVKSRIEDLPHAFCLSEKEV